MRRWAQLSRYASGNLASAIACREAAVEDKISTINCVEQPGLLELVVAGREILPPSFKPTASLAVSMFKRFTGHKLRQRDVFWTEDEQFRLHERIITLRSHPGRPRQAIRSDSRILGSSGSSLIELAANLRVYVNYSRPALRRYQSQVKIRPRVN
jgi:hypothetical protein